MLQFIVKTGKIGFWVLLPLFLISNTGAVEVLPVNPSVDNGNYLFKTSGTFDNVLAGQIVFTKEVDSIGNGKSITRLELKLDHVEKTLQHNMGFIISKHLSRPGDLTGRYEVKAKAAGVSNNVDGVFGFADISVLGEQPFFTDIGTVNITSLSDGDLHGDLTITFRNFEGRNFDISGDFIATESK